MTFDVIIAGFGGQGVLFAGQLLAHTALDAGLELYVSPQGAMECDRTPRTSSPS